MTSDVLQLDARLHEEAVVRDLHRDLAAVPEPHLAGAAESPGPASPMSASSCGFAQRAKDALLAAHRIHVLTDSDSQKIFPRII